MEAFRFENELYLQALWLLFLVGGLWWMGIAFRKKAIRKLGEQQQIMKLAPQYSFRRPLVKGFFVMLGFAFLVIGLANPQFGAKLETVQREGVEIIFAIDVSNSMLAEDIRPNRLENAVRSISLILRRLSNDRVGLIVFAGEAYVQLPVTADFQAANMFLKGISTDIVPVQGTAIGKALELAIRSFSQDEAKNKTIVVITDGEDHEENAIEMAKKAAAQGIVVHTIGMGLAQGAPIPVKLANGQTDYRKDREGKIVITKLNEGMLQQIADAGQGSYVRASNSSSSVDLIYRKIQEMEKQSYEAKVYSDYESWFQWFLGAAAMCLMLETVIASKKNKWLSKLNPYRMKI
jgi:Ca-activated chloride channel family protein